MLQYQGQFASAKVFTDDIEQEAIQQLYNLMNSPVFEGDCIRIMPDVHSGSGCVIGFTAPLTDKVIPNLIGVDIGCGVCSLNLQLDDVDFDKFDKVVRRVVPHGFGIQEKYLDRNVERVYSKLIASNYKRFEKEIEETVLSTNQDLRRVFKSIGTLGGGNHFIELNKEEDGSVWLTIHSGSRNFGLRIATYYQGLAKKSQVEENNNDLEYLTGDLRESYLTAMEIAQKYAKLNRLMILNQIVLGMKWDQNKLLKGELIESIHNYISFEDNIIRKGAISAHEGESVIIPFNMRDGLIIGKGKGNVDWNNSAPHGAGRVYSRTKAKKELSLELFEKEMKGIWSSCISNNTLDESPMAYKSSDKIRELILPTVEIVKLMRPIYNFKSSKE